MKGAKRKIPLRNERKREAMKISCGKKGSRGGYSEMSRRAITKRGCHGASGMTHCGFSESRDLDDGETYCEECVKASQKGGNISNWFTYALLDWNRIHDSIVARTLRRRKKALRRNPFGFTSSAQSHFSLPPSNVNIWELGRRRLPFV